MPSFQDTFSKQQTQQNLQYDNTAFLHFSITLSLTALFLLTYLLIRQLFCDKRSAHIRLVKGNTLFERQVTAEEKIKSDMMKTSSVKWKIIVMVVLIATTCLAWREVMHQDNRIKGFDPYELLGVDADTPLERIRKAYRKLALELHPDRNPNDPIAASKFILVSKAYECLTDEKLKQNCLKFGNPDGQLSFKVGIALPSFLIQKDNHIIVMFWTFAILIIIVPKLFLSWNSKLLSKDERGILVDNYENMYERLKRSLTRQSVDLMVSSMTEVTDLALQNGESIIIKVKRQQRQGVMQQEGEEEEIVLTASMKANLQELSNYRKGLYTYSKLITRFPHLLRQIIVFSLDFCIRHRIRKSYIFPNLEKVVIPFQGIIQLESLIRYSQEFYQNKPRSIHSLNQLSLTEQEQQNYGKKITIFQLVKHQPVRDAFYALIADEERRGRLAKQISSLPNLNLNTITMAGKQIGDTFTNNDIVTIQFTITRENSNQKKKDIAYLREYPYLKEEKYYLTLQSTGVLVFFEEVTLLPGKPYEAAYNYVHRGSPMIMNFKATLFSDCYYGLDIEQLVPVKFVEFTGSRKIKFHPVDKNLERIPKNLLEEAFNLNINGAGEDELLSDTEEQAGQISQPESNMHEHSDNCCGHLHEEEQIGQQLKDNKKQNGESHNEQHKHKEKSEGSQQQDNEDWEDEDD